MASVALGAVAVADAAWAQTKTFDVPAQPAATGVAAFARQADVQVLISASDAQGRRTNAVRGAYPVPQALQMLLAGTGLTAQATGAQTWTVVRVPPAEAAAPFAAAEPAVLGELIVTAQKREERLIDVPAPVTAIRGDALADAGQLRLQDYYFRIPGLGLALIGDGSTPTVTIRGITTGGLTNPTVGIVVDEVSYGATITALTAPSAPDIDPGDLARVEVLRGPQGTLYGASSMGGLLKYVTIDPDPSRFGGRLQIGASMVRHGDEPGHVLRGAVNVPLGQGLAVRVSGFSTREPGYVDNVATGEQDVNRRDSQGGRVSLLWRASDDLTVKLSALVQDSERKGPQDVDSALGGALAQRALAGTGLYGRNTTAYSATINGRLGMADWVSATGYSVDKIDTRIDQSAAFGAIANANFGVTGVAGPLHRRIEKFTQEVRVSAPLGDRIEALAGAFYTKEDISLRLVYAAVNPVTGAEPGVLFTNVQPNTFEEYAAFGSLTFEVSERFDIQVGGRYSTNEQSFSGVRTGPLALLLLRADPSIVPREEADDSSFTYLVTPRFRITPDLMAYARVASGYRPGGANPGCGAPGVLCQFDPDTTINYEAGLKGAVLDGRLTVDGSLYYVDWKDIQFPLTIAGVGYTANAGRARSQGIELSAELRPAQGLSIAGWMAFNDAELTEGFPTTATNVTARKGDRLPYSSRRSGSVSVDKLFELSDTNSLNLGATVSYVGDRKGIFRPTTARETFPAYTQVDLRAEFRSGDWALNVFVNNATDERGVLRSGVDALRPTYLTYTQPRTVGISLERTF